MSYPIDLFAPEEANKTGPRRHINKSKTAHQTAQIDFDHELSSFTSEYNTREVSEWLVNSLSQ